MVTMMPNTDSSPISPIAAIHPALASALAEKGYSQLTPVQMAITNEEYRDVDLLVSAQIGSGKTVAYSIAIAPTLLESAERFDEAGAPLGLIIAPTRELAIQVRRELDWVFATTQIRIATCVGGMDIRANAVCLNVALILSSALPGTCATTSHGERWT